MRKLKGEGMVYDRKDVLKVGLIWAPLVVLMQLYNLVVDLFGWLCFIVCMPYLLFKPSGITTIEDIVMAVQIRL